MLRTVPVNTTRRVVKCDNMVITIGNDQNKAKPKIFIKNIVEWFWTRGVASRLYKKQCEVRVPKLTIHTWL